jgi:hypothetical protein
MATSEDLKTRYDTLYQDLKQFYLETTNGKLTLNTITTLTRYAMEHVQINALWANLKGSEKKELVLTVVTDFMGDLLNDPELKITDETRDLLKNGLLMVPFMIDAAVDFAKTYNVFKQSIFSTGKSKLCCFKKSKN